MAFDLLHLDGQDLTGRPLVERKQLLDDLHLVGPAWATNGWYPVLTATGSSRSAPNLGTKASWRSGWTLRYLPGIRSRAWLSARLMAGRETIPAPTAGAGLASVYVAL